MRHPATTVCKLSVVMAFLLVPPRLSQRRALRAGYCGRRLR
jgi:hypothetical protein